jgi:hypothetical protein
LSGCSSLTFLTIPGSVQSLGDDCFCGCASLTSLTIPGSVQSLGNNCFCECSSLTSLTIPNSVVEIGAECFAECVSLQNFGISLQNSPKVQNHFLKKKHSLYSKAGSKLFIGCPFKCTQLIHQVQ